MTAAVHLFQDNDQGLIFILNFKCGRFSLRTNTILLFNVLKIHVAIKLFFFYLYKLELRCLVYQTTQVLGI